jgi:hypothetical protein
MIFILITNNIVTNVIVADSNFIETHDGTGLYDLALGYTEDQWHPGTGYIYNNGTFTAPPDPNEGVDDGS